MSMQCSNCAAEVPEEANFCSDCGHSVSQEVGQKVHPKQGEWSFSNHPQNSSTLSLSATSDGGGSHPVLEKWSGLAAIGAGILWWVTLPLAIVLNLVLPESPRTLPGLLIVSLFTLSILLLAIALPGLHTRHARRGRRLRWAGLILTMIGLVLITAWLGAQGFAQVSPTAAFSLWLNSWNSGSTVVGSIWLGAGVATLVGIALFGIATAVANVLPRWAALMFALGLPVGIASGVLYALLLAKAMGDPDLGGMFVACFIGLAICALGLIRLGYALWAHVRVKKKLSKQLPELSRTYSRRSRLPRTGFGNKTVWDWLQLLIVPIVLAVASFWFTLQQDIRQQATEEQRAQDAALQAYLDKIGDFMLRNDGPLGESKEGDEVNTLARSRTLTVLSRLEGDQKARVVQFLYEAGLIGKERPVLDLRGAALSDVLLKNADLSGADLSGVALTNANLRNTDLGGATLSGADLTNANLLNADLLNADLLNADLSRASLLDDADLRGANLSGAVLRYAFLDGANLSGANLSGANFSDTNMINASLAGAELLNNANLSGANLQGADLSLADLSDADLSDAALSDANLDRTDLSGADLSGADLSDAYLGGAEGVSCQQTQDAKSLDGATMPNEQKYKDWLKGREGCRE